MDPQNLPQSTPVVPAVDPNIGNINEMPLENITGAYDDISSSINQMGQNIVGDIAGRQQQLIGSNFSAPNEGAIGNYNEASYIEPAITSAQSQVKQIGTQVALTEGMRRGREAAENALKDAQKRYNEKVAEQNRQAAQQAQQAQQAALNNDKAGVNSIDAGFLKEKGLTQDDFNGLDAAQRSSLIGEYHDKVRGIDWDYKGNSWYSAVDATYKHFGITGDAAKDERTGAQTEANKKFWGRADVGKYFAEQSLNRYGNGAQILQQKHQFIEQTKVAIDRWMKPQTKEDAALSFDQVFRSVDIKLPKLNADKEAGYYGSGSREERINQLTKDEEARSRLSDSDNAYLDRMEKQREKGVKISSQDQLRVYGVLSRADAVESKVTVITPAQILEGLYGLDQKELIALKKFKESNSAQFERTMNIVNKVRGGTFISMSDGRDIPDNYYRDPASGQLKLASNGQYIIHSVAGGSQDPSLDRIRQMIDDDGFMESVRRAETDDSLATSDDKKKQTQFYKAMQEYQQAQVVALTIGDFYNTNAGTSLYNAALYKSGGGEETGKLQLRGRKINDWVWEWRSKARDNQDEAAAAFRDLIAVASKDRGFFIGDNGQRIDLVDDKGASSITAKNNHFQDWSVEEAAALLTVLQKELNTGGISSNFLGRGPGTGTAGEAGAKALGVIEDIGSLSVAAAGFLLGGALDDEFKTARGKMFYGGMERFLYNLPGEVDYVTRRDEENYDIFKTLIDVQYSADGKDGYFAKNTDLGVGMKRFSGELAAIGTDIALGVVGPMVAKGLVFGASKKIGEKIAATAGEKIASGLRDRVAKNVGIEAGADAAVFEVKNSAGITTKKTLNEVSTDLARLGLEGKSAAQYLKQIDADAFKGVGAATIDKIIDNAWGNKIAKNLGVANSAKKTIKHINADIAGISALTTSGIRMSTIRQASAPALRAAVRLIGESGDDVLGVAARTRKNLSVTASKVAASKGAAPSAITATNKELGGLTGREIARKLVEESARQGMNGRTMDKYAVMKFLARNGDKSSQNMMFIKRFAEGELIGQPLFFLQEARNSGTIGSDINHIQQPGYMMTQAILGSAIGLGGMGIARGFRSAQLQQTQAKLRDIQDTLARNAQDIDSPEYRKAAAELARISAKADRLSDNAMQFAFDPSKVAEFRKTAADAQEAISEQLTHLHKQVDPSKDYARSQAATEMISALNAKIGFGARYINVMSAAKLEATISLRQLHNDLPHLSAYDDKASARITAAAYDAVNKLPEGSSFEVRREAFTEGIARAMTGVSYREARREAEYLMDAYDQEWAKVKKSFQEDGFDVTSFGGNARADYLSPAGVTHTMTDNLEKVYWGLVSERQVNADITDFTKQREADFGAVARAWANGTPIQSGNIKVRNPDGFNLVTALQTYRNQSNSRRYIDAIDNNIVRNGDAVVVGEKNLTAAIEADKKYYETALGMMKKQLSELMVKNKSAIKAAMDDNAAIDAAEKALDAASRKLASMKSVGMPPEAIKVASEAIGVTEKQFSKAYMNIAKQFKANKDGILAGKKPVEAIARFTKPNGDYNRDALLDATFRYIRSKRATVIPATDDAVPQAKSQYLHGVNQVEQATILKRIGGNKERAYRLINEAMRNYSEGDEAFGAGDVARYVAERMPLGHGKNALQYEELSRSIARIGDDPEALKEAARNVLNTIDDQEQRENVFQLILALDSERLESSVRLRSLDEVGGAEDGTGSSYNDAIVNQDDITGQAKQVEQFSYQSGAMDAFSALDTESKQTAIDTLRDALRSIDNTSAKKAEAPKEKPQKVVDRQDNLADIVADANMSEPGFAAEMENRLWKNDGKRIRVNGSMQKQADLQKIVIPGVAATESKLNLNGSMLEELDSAITDYAKSMGIKNPEDLAVFTIVERSGDMREDLGVMQAAYDDIVATLRQLHEGGEISKEQLDEMIGSDMSGDIRDGGIKSIIKDITKDYDKGEELDDIALMESFSATPGSTRGRISKTAKGGFAVRLPSEETVMYGDALSRFYRNIDDSVFSTAEQEATVKQAKAVLKKARDEKKQKVEAIVAESKRTAPEDKATAKTLMKQIKTAEEALSSIKSHAPGNGYTNRMGLRFLGDTNGLSGYTKIGVLLEAQQAEKTLEGFHPIENRRIRRKNRQEGRVNRQSLNARYANYNKIIKRVQQKASGDAEQAEQVVTSDILEQLSDKNKATLGSTVRINDAAPEYGVLIDKDDLLVHEGLAAVKSIEQRQFASSQGMQMFLLKMAGFNKGIQNIQLAAGYSMFNAYSFRYLLSAMMQNPTKALPMLNAFSDARNMKTVANFWGQNQELFNRVTMVTGDSMYVDAFSDANSQLADYSTGYMTRLKNAHKDSRYQERMTRYTKEEREKIAEERGYDSWKNAPKYDSSSAQAEMRGGITHTGQTVARAVELTFDAPTFQRYIPVLQGTMFLKNYEIALRRANKLAMKRFKNGERESFMPTMEDMDSAIMFAHLRTKLFFHPMATSGSARQFLLGQLKGNAFDSNAARQFIQQLTKEEIESITRGNQGQNLSKILSSLFFALQYKATQLGQMLNGIRGVGRPDSFVLSGGRNQVTIMSALVAAAYVYNEINGRETAFDDPEKTLINLNNLGKFKLGNGDKTASIDPFFSQFTLVNSMMRMGYGLAGIEGGTAMGNNNPHRGIGLPGTPLYVRGELPLRFSAVQDEVTSNLLSPYKAFTELLTNNTYFGNNIWEHPRMRDGSVNPNYNPLRNVGASVMHMMNLGINEGKIGAASTNAWVKGANTTGDRIGFVGGSGIIQHPYLDTIQAFQSGDYAEAMFTAMEMPVKWDNISGAARGSLNGYVIKSIAGYKKDYDRKVEAANGDSAAIDQAYREYAQQSIKTINDWSVRHGDVLENDPKLVSAAQKILTGFLSSEYDDNLNKMQSAFWRASIDSQMGDDFGWDIKPGESEDAFLARKEKTNKFYFEQLDREYEARKTLKEQGFDVKGYEYDDMMTEYRNLHRNVIAQFEKAIKGKVNGFKNLEESKRNYEMRINNVDSIYTNQKKAREKKSELAQQHNKQVFDLLTPYVEKYGSYALDFYDRSGKRGLADMAAALLIIPANEMPKYGMNKTPTKNYLKDHFGVGYRNRSNLPSDAEFRKKFEQVNARLSSGKTASASTLLDRIIKEVQQGSYGVSGNDWSRVVRYREIINGRLGF